MLFFYAFIVLLKLQAVFSIKRPNPNDDFKNQLVALIESHEKYINTAGGTKKNDGNVDNNKSLSRSSDSIAIEVIGKFEKELIFIYRQFENYYKRKLPDTKKIADELANNKEGQHAIAKPTEYENALCSLMPRCLDFVNVSTNRPKLFFMYKMHWVFCRSVPSFIQSYCKEDKDRGVALCDTSTLHVLFSNVGTFREIDTAYAGDDYQAVSSKFLLEAYCLVNDIDRTPMIRNNRLPYDVVFALAADEYRNPTLEPSRWSGGDAEKNRKLESGIREINDAYKRELAARCGPFEELSADMSSGETVNALMKHTLERLEKYFKFTVSGKPSPPDSPEPNAGRGAVERLMSDTFGRLCEYAPLILVYLSGNGADARLFDMYLTLCADHVSFFDDRCYVSEPNGQSSYDMHCVRESLRDKLSVNFHTVAGTVSEYDAGDGRCADEYFGYVKNVYDAVSGQYADAPVWTSVAWLTGKHFFAEHHGDSLDMDRLKYAAVFREGVQTNLTEAYHQMLPWTANAQSVTVFYNAVRINVHRMVDEYVYRHGKIVVLYLEHANGNVDREVLERLKKTVKWYDGAAALLDEYFGAPFGGEPRGHVRAVVTEIENVDGADGIGKIGNAVPAANADGLSQWANYALQGDPSTGSPVRFEEMARENCSNAVKFMNALVLIARKSKLAIYVKANINDMNLHCTA